MDNLLEVSEGDDVHHVALAVPTGLFTLMKDVLKVDPAERVSLALDKVEDRWHFCLMRGEEKLYDLWSYGASLAPAWIFEPDYWIEPETP